MNRRAHWHYTGCWAGACSRREEGWDTSGALDLTRLALAWLGLAWLGLAWLDLGHAWSAPQAGRPQRVVEVCMAVMRAYVMLHTSSMDRCRRGADEAKIIRGPVRRPPQVEGSWLACEGGIQESAQSSLCRRLVTRYDDAERPPRGLSGGCLCAVCGLRSGLLCAPSRGPWNKMYIVARDRACLLEGGRTRAWACRY